MIFPGVGFFRRRPFGLPERKTTKLNSPAPRRSWYFSEYASSGLASPSIMTPTRLTFLPPSVDASSASSVPAAAVGQGKAADEWKASRVARTFTGTPVATDSSWSSLMAAASSAVDWGRRTTSTSQRRYQ